MTEKSEPKVESKDEGKSNKKEKPEKGNKRKTHTSSEHTKRVINK